MSELLESMDMQMAALEAERDRLRAELEQVKRERDETHGRVAEVARMIDPEVCPDAWGLRDAAAKVLRRLSEAEARLETEREQRRKRISIIHDANQSLRSRVKELEGALEYVQHHLEHGGLYGPWREMAKQRVLAALRPSTTTFAADPVCASCGHVASDHRAQIDGGTCGAPTEDGRCHCRADPTASKEPQPARTGPADAENHQCGGPREACCVPGCQECGQPEEHGSWCVECGPMVRVDEDGCCGSCGTSAMGPWADRAVALWRASQPQPAPQVDVERVRTELADALVYLGDALIESAKEAIGRADALLSTPKGGR